MTAMSVVYRFIILTSAILWFSGCFPVSNSELDEEKETYYLKGKSLANSLDYKGAIEAFEKALEVNPRSASAHFELGLLYEQKMNDYASAIYHFQKHLALRPKSNLAETVEARIKSCKLELAKTVPYALVSSQVQAGMDRVNAENTTLRQQVEELKAQVAQQAALLTNRTPAQVSDQSERSGSKPSQSAQQTISNNQANQQRLTREQNVAKKNETVKRTTQTVAPRQATSTRTPPSESKPASASRSLRPHTVRPGDTIASIARRHGVSQSDLMAANPGLRARRIKEGQIVYIPVRN